MINDSRECKSSEEMRASFEDFNRNLDEAIRKKVHILSMDIKSLYPSLKKAVSKDAINTFYYFYQPNLQGFSIVTLAMHNQTLSD